MTRRFLSILFVIFISALSFGQDIQGKWELTTKKGDFIELNKGNYQIKISKDSLVQQGDFLIQDSSLFLFGKRLVRPDK